MKKNILFILCVLLSCSSNNKNENEGSGNITKGGELFASNLEDEDSGCWSTRNDSSNEWNLAGCGRFINIGKKKSVSLAENEISHSGNKSIKITFEENEDYGGAEVAFDDSRHIYTRYYDYYSTGFDFAYGMKVHRIRSFDNIKGLNNYDLVSLAWGDPTYGEYNLSGSNDMYLLSINYNGGESEWGSAESSFSFSRDTWYCVETEVKLNSPGDADGEVRIWVDGSLTAEETSLDITGSNKGGLNLILFGGWYSNGATGANPQPNPDSTSVRYIDDIAISTNRIGCL